MLMGVHFLWSSPGWLPYPLSWVACCASTRVCPGRCSGEEPFLLILVLGRAGSTLVRCFQFQAMSWKISACIAKTPLDPSSAAQHLLAMSLLFSPSWLGVLSPRLALQWGFSGQYGCSLLFSALLLGNHCPIDPVLLCEL